MPRGIYPRDTHGACSGEQAKHRPVEYTAWRTMKGRCYNPANQDFKDYGGRGIQVCERWRHDYAAFLADMGPRPSGNMSLDRIDSNGHYEPSNCRWATATEQVRGRRKAIFATVNGERLPLVVWARRLGISYSALWRRARLHSPEQAVQQPPRLMLGRRLTHEEAQRMGRLSGTSRKRNQLPGETD